MITIKARHLLIVAALAFAPLAHAQMKIGIVSMNDIFTSYQKTKDAEVKLNESRATAKTQLDAQIEKLKTAMNEVNDLDTSAKKAGMSAEAKKKAEATLEAKVSEARNLDRQIAEFRQNQERTLQEQYMRMRKDILDDIMKVLNDKVKAAGYDLVFDKSGLSMGQIPVVVYARNDLEFTKEIIDALGKSNPSAKQK